MKCRNIHKVKNITIFLYNVCVFVRGINWINNTFFIKDCLKFSARLKIMPIE